MTESSQPYEFVCRDCRTSLQVAQPGAILCPNCGWKGEFYAFPDAIPLEINQPENALPENAVCLHHPNKKAMHTCSATGDYICALCAIELDGAVYGVEYLNSTAGRQKIREIYKCILKRPDRIILVYFITLIIPIINIATSALAVVWIFHGYSLHRQATKAHETDPLYARAVTKRALRLYFFFLTLALILWVAAVILIAYNLATGSPPFQFPR